VVAAGVTANVPLVASVPVHPPLAVHEVAFVLDHVNVELLPADIVVGFAVSVTVGSGALLTVTVADAGAEVVPSVPAQAREYVVVAVGDTARVPLIASVPVQPPLAVHDVELVLDQVSVELAPAVIVAGFAVNVTVGAVEGLTVTVADAIPVPPVPAQDSVYVVVAVGDTTWVPLVASAPVQPPDAVHEVALVLDQVSVEVLPESMVVGLAVNVTVGVPGG